MTDRPIIFTGESVRAILEGRKSQTRRAMKNQPELREYYKPYHPQQNNGVWTWLVHTDRPGYAFAVGDRRCPYGVPGDRLWVKESVYRSECGKYLARPLGGGTFEAWASDGSIHWLNDDRVKTWEDAAKFRHPLDYCVGGYSAEKTGQKKGSFTLNLLHCDTSKQIEPFKGNTIIESRDIVFRRKTAFMPRWASRITLEITDVRVQRVQEISFKDCIAEGIPPIGREHDTAIPRNEYRALWDSINAHRGFSWESNPWVWAVTFRRLP